MSAYERRHSRWYEKLILSLPVQFLLGSLAVVMLPSTLKWGWVVWQAPNDVEVNTVVTSVLCLLLAIVTQRRLNRFPGAHTASYILPFVTGIFLAAVTLLFFTRAGYSRHILLTSYTLTLAWCFMVYFLGRRFRTLKLAVVPLGDARDLVPANNMMLCRLETPDLGGGRYDGLVADLHSEDMSPEWERFLARCTLSKIPVYHIKQIRESLTGRVKIDHMSENEFGTLLPSELYSGFKRLADVVGVAVTLPVTMPLMLLTALAIKLDSPGPVLFVQPRVGQGGREYHIYKFRSMRIDSEKDGAKLARAADDRITRVGRVIRRTRLDELPQFFNVLKGDMSLIGPRPEQRAFVERFEREIPFYVYRHVVKPGITGWAQVIQGYAGNAEDTRIKIQHDFYYIKHFSLWLDLLITFKTIKTILTGFGAR